MLGVHTVRGNPSSVVTSTSLAASRSAVKNMLKLAIFMLLVFMRKGDGAGIVIGFANGERISKVVTDGGGESNRRQLIDDEESA